eukprot:362070-Chlamydomonas_euryale.AAC.4
MFKQAGTWFMVLSAINCNFLACGRGPKVTTPGKVSATVSALRGCLGCGREKGGHAVQRMHREQ